MSKRSFSMTNSKHVDILRGALEVYGDGSFEEIFDYSWTTLDQAIRAGRDYVSVKDRAAFEKQIVEEFDKIK